MMHTRAYIINITLCLGGLLFASCGKQYTAEQTVKDFVAENMQDGVETSGVDFADLGTTRHINDTLVQKRHSVCSSTRWRSVLSENEILISG